MLSFADKQKLAEYLQVNIFSDFQGITSFKQIKEKPTTLFDLIISDAFADDDSDFAKTITQNMRGLVLESPKLLGAAFFVAGGFALISKNITGIWWKIAGGISVLTGIALLTSKASASLEYINNVHNLDPSSFYLKYPNRINSGENTIVNLWSQAIPLDSILSSSSLITQTIDAKENANLEFEKINEQLSFINSTLALIGTSTIIDPLPLFSFPQTRFQTILSSKYISNVQIISSEDGQAFVQNYLINENNISITFKSSKTQKAKLRVTFINTDLGINKNIDTDVIIVAGPNAVFNYTTNKLTVTFDSTDVSDPNGNYSYAWYFGDGVGENTQSKKIIHKFDHPGTYQVDLIVFDQYGQSSLKLSKQVEVIAAYDIPLTNFSYDSSSMYFFWPDHFPLVAVTSSPFIPNFSNNTITQYLYSYNNNASFTMDLLLSRNYNLDITVNFSANNDPNSADYSYVKCSVNGGAQQIFYGGSTYTFHIQPNINSEGQLTCYLGWGHSASVVVTKMSLTPINLNLLGSN